MKAAQKFTWKSKKPDNWVLNVQIFPQANSFVSSSSDGSLNFYLLNKISSDPLATNENAHEGAINSLVKIENDMVGSCATDGLKVWDLRLSGDPVYHLTHGQASNMLSLAYSNHRIAAGTELHGTDAELHIWDLRNPKDVVRTFADSHHDDITSIEFHPIFSNYLMSGATDGYVNIYNLKEQDEEDALHQVINYASVHSCTFTQEKRIAVLSHMETLAFYELNNTNYEIAEEPAPHDIGDVRGLWKDCEYVVDLSLSGYITYGANSKLNLTLLRFNPIAETFDLENPIQFPEAHGDEVVRDLKVLGNLSLTCGEDGNIKLWELPSKVQTYSVSGKEEYMNTDDDTTRHTRKDVSKEHKKKKKKKEKKDIRFKPY
ncbi:uncharacterized protein PRCAT00004186001 [Priceomyces carsonii]|uniref:uncharacterized protein n=1 Tax=Priceomyces carsonii TaxID=28549 RepID=UPI002ED78402|nr:unnamed protein product [Priceomyces carsonii]